MAATVGSLNTLNAEYKELTGDDYFLYSSGSFPNSDRGRRFVFADGTVYNRTEAEQRMRGALEDARAAK